LSLITFDFTQSAIVVISPVAADLDIGDNGTSQFEGKEEQDG
jgi:hypothetical protein